MKRLLTSFTLALFVLAFVGQAFAAETITCWFPPGWSAKEAQATQIAAALAEKSGLDVQAQIAGSYPEILAAFSADEPNLVYVGSFVQAIIAARKLGTPLAQNNNGKQMYSGIMIYPQGSDPLAILSNSPQETAFAVGASSGESSAKAATAGLAAVPVANHAKAVEAIQSGSAKAAFVKNWWWQTNKEKYPNMSSFSVPGVSSEKNPDNVLTASKAIPAEDRDKLRQAALASSEVFGPGSVMTPFESAKLAFSLGLMQKGKIDPLTYTW